MAVSREERRRERQPRVEEVFGAATAPRALDLLELTELAWHDCYGDVTPPDDIVDDLLTCSEGDLGKLIAAARLAVTDWRDLKLTAQAIRANDQP